MKLAVLLFFAELVAFALLAIVSIHLFKFAVGISLICFAVETLFFKLDGNLVE